MPTLRRDNSITLELVPGQRLDVGKGGIAWQEGGAFSQDFTRWPAILGPFTTPIVLTISAVDSDLAYEVMQEQERAVAAVLVDEVPEVGRTGLIYLTPDGPRYFYEPTGEFLTLTESGSVPGDDDPPVIAGDAEVDAVLTVTSPGTWTNRPTSYSYQWQIDGSDVEGETGLTFVVPAEAEGFDVTCNVVATNVVGNSDPSPSNAIGIPGE